MKKIVISAVNLKVGGTLTILRDCLRHLSGLAATGEYQVIALVYDRKVADYPHVEYIELKWPKKNWFNRLWCEYVAMRKISVRLAPVYLWLSLQCKGTKKSRLLPQFISLLSLENERNPVCSEDSAVFTILQIRVSD